MNHALARTMTNILNAFLIALRPKHARGNDLQNQT
jgi:hypothetical protein